MAALWVRGSSLGLPLLLCASTLITMDEFLKLQVGISLFHNCAKVVRAMNALDMWSFLGPDGYTVSPQTPGSLSRDPADNHVGQKVSLCGVNYALDSTNV